MSHAKEIWLTLLTSFKHVPFGLQKNIALKDTFLN